MELRESEVDGVPVVWSEVPGPLRAGLVFRVGEADERLVEHGVTHLVEHAAIRKAGRGQSLGGTVGLLETHFEVWGGEEDVVVALAALCDALGALPRESLAVERRVLATEAAASGSALPHLLLHERCGARGVGVAALEELGLRALDDDAVLAWAARWFVRGNAALWVSGPPPAGLSLELPDGDRGLLPEARPLPGLVLPARVDGPAGAAAIGALATSGPDDVLAGVVAAALERRAHESLRTTLGVSYDVDGRARLVSRDARHVVVMADCQHEHAAGVAQDLLAVWRDVAGGAAIEDGREHLLRFGRRALAEPDGQRAALERNAGRLLVGYQVLTPAEALERVTAVDVGEVAALADALSGELIASVPEGAGAGVELPKLVRPTGEAVTGRRFTRRRAPHHLDAPAAVIVGDAGLTAEGESDEATIRFTDAVAAIERFGGGLDVVSVDGQLVSVHPADLRDGDEAVAAIREALPADVVVPLDLRARRLQQAAAEQFDRTWVVGPALEHVWPLLAWDEELRVLAEASRGIRAGVLVVTDRRVVLVTKVLGEHIDEWSRGAIRKASGRDVGVAARLRLELTDGDNVTLWVGPRGRLKRLSAELDDSAD